MTTPASEEEEFTELIDADFPRVDLVGKAANGIPRFLIAKQDGAAGLLDPEFVRDLIAKAEPDPPGRERVTMPSGVTLSGSPADIAAFIHKAAQRAAEPGPADVLKAARDAYEQVIKAKYNAADLKRMASSGAAMADESYPIGDREDLGKAIRAVGRGGASHNAIRKHIITRARSLGASSEIPDNWAADGSLKEDSVSKSDTVTKDMGPDLDDGIDGMDPTVPLAAPDEEAPGDPTDPGSPAWEAIDAATASKWTSILSRARVAIDILAERELLEAASADPDDAENAWDLQDVCCAIDYAISVLAPFAVAEQSEADCGTDAMAMIGKAMAGFDTLPVDLDRIGALSYVAKAGRVLSSANEAEIRGAAASLQKVLASLPSAPTVDDQVTKEAAMADTQTTTGQDAATVAKTASPDEQALGTGPVNAGGTTGLGEPRTSGPADALPADGPQQARPGDLPGRTVVKALSDALKVAVYDRDRQLVHVPANRIYDGIAKADGDGKVTMQAVFDENGNLVGIVDPADITPVAGAGGKPDDGGASGEEPAAPPADAASLTPQPAAEAGTPADGVAKQGHGGTITIAQDVLKSTVTDAVSAALAAQGATHQEAIAKMAAESGGLAEQVEVLKGRLETVENNPAAPKVFTNGQTPPAHQLRGQDRTQQGAPAVDVAKAAALKGTLYHGSAQEQNKAFGEMQEMAIAALSAVHGRP